MSTYILLKNASMPLNISIYDYSLITKDNILLKLNPFFTILLYILKPLFYIIL